VRKRQNYNCRVLSLNVSMLSEILPLIICLKFDLLIFDDNFVLILEILREIELNERFNDDFKKGKLSKKRKEYSVIN